MATEIGILFALASMLSWGVADFLAKKAIDRIGHVKSLMIVQTAALAPLAVYAFATSALPEMSLNLVLAVTATAFFGISGYFHFFKSMKKGSLSIVSPVSSSYGAVTVILSAFLFGETLTQLQMAGVAAIIAGVFLVSTDFRELRKSIKRGMTNGILEAFVAMLSWGATYTLIKYVVEMSGPSMGVLLLRMVMMMFSLLFLRAGIFKVSGGMPGKMVTLLLVASGIVDVAGVVAYGMGVMTELVSIVGVVSSMYPAIAVVLAYFFLKERVVGNQKFGIVSILAGLMLISIV